MYDQSCIFYSWIGTTDLVAAGLVKDERTVEKPGLGPIADTLNSILSQKKPDIRIDSVILLSAFPKKQSDKYRSWIETVVPFLPKLKLFCNAFDNPNDFSVIYDHVSNVINQIKLEYNLPFSSVFYISPGTPMMSAVWVIIAKSKHPAALIETSRYGYSPSLISTPVDLSINYIRDVLRISNKALTSTKKAEDSKRKGVDRIITADPKMMGLKQQIKKLALYDKAPVLLLGETGTGKEEFAHALHEESPRHSGPFVAVNCGALPETLLEAELFGHEKGAFTGADKARIGKIEQADKGTLFLDEIGEMPKSAQVRLLRVLHDSLVVRVGGNEERKINVRFIAATNRNLSEEVLENRFRIDLYHRLAVIIFEIPPLRERGDDVILLSNIFLDAINAENQNTLNYKKRSLSKIAQDILRKYYFPGNVRELYNLLNRAAILCDTPVIDESVIQQFSVPSVLRQQYRPVKTEDNCMETERNFSQIIARMKINLIEKALAQNSNNKTLAAKQLGFNNRQTMMNLFRKAKQTLGLD